MPRIPFQIELHHGLSQVNGLLYLEREFVVFEFAVKKLGLFEDQPEIVKAEHGLIDHMRLDKGLFHDTVCIIPTRLDLLKAIPSNHRTELRLKVRRKYRDEVRDLIGEITGEKYLKLR